MQGCATCAPAAIVFASLLDAAAPAGGPLRDAPLWLDLAGLAALGLAAFARPRGPWKTPFDGRIAAGLAVSVTQCFAPQLGGAGVVWLHQMLACGLAYYGTVALIRQAPASREAMWRVFAFAAVALTAHALWAATSGATRLVQLSAVADRAWAADHGLVRALMFATVVTAGRALEPASAPPWRLAALLGTVGVALHLAVGGIGLTSNLLARLDDPVYFSAMCVLLLLLAGLARAAWLTRIARRAEATRWRTMALAFTLLGFESAYGATTGGEGLRVLATVAAALIVTTAEAPADTGAAHAEADAPEERLARAA